MSALASPRSLQLDNTRIPRMQTSLELISKGASYAASAWLFNNMPPLAGAIAGVSKCICDKVIEACNSDPLYPTTDRTTSEVTRIATYLLSTATGALAANIAGFRVSFFSVIFLDITSTPIYLAGYLVLAVILGISIYAVNKIKGLNNANA